MAVTSYQVTRILLAVILAVLQAVILLLVSADIPDLLSANEYGDLAVIFAPTYGIVWALKDTGRGKEG